MSTIIWHDNNITLNFPSVSGAIKYHCRVSKYMDMSVIAHEDNNLADSEYVFVNTAGDGKFYWQYRSYESSWGTWSELNSFVVNTGLTASATIDDNSWTLFKRLNPTDKYKLTFYPQYDITREKLNRVDSRTKNIMFYPEYYNTKEIITFNYSKNICPKADMNEILRFYYNASSFYIANSYCYDGTNYTTRIWEVMITNDRIELTPLAGRREELCNSSITFTEV